MKYIKKFNEELSPETYINAGHSLKYMGKSKRSSALIDHGNELKYGNYNMVLANSSGIIAKDNFTRPVCNFYFGQPNSNSVTRVSEDDIIRLWEEGESGLIVTFEFCFYATESTKINKNTSTTRGVFERHSGVPMFSISVALTDWNDGLDNWRTDYGTHEDAPHVDISELYRWTHCVIPSIDKPVDVQYFGIFADRKSALKFKRELPKLIEPYKEKIVDLLGSLNASSEDIDKYDDIMSKIRINYLYDDETSSSNQSLDKKWFRGSDITQN